MVHFNEKSHGEEKKNICLHRFLFVKLLDVCWATAALSASVGHAPRLNVRPLIPPL